MIIAESRLPRYKRSAALYGGLSDIPVGMDILVYTPAEVEEWNNVTPIRVSRLSPSRVDSEIYIQPGITR